MKKLLIALALVSSLSISGCALWDTLNPFKGGKGIDVDAEMTIGDKKEEVNTEVTGSKEETHNIADQVYNTYQTVDEQYPAWILILLVLGWMLPSPAQLWRGLLRLFKRR